MNSIVLLFNDTRPKYYGIQDPFVYENKENINDADIEYNFFGHRIKS